MSLQTAIFVVAIVMVFACWATIMAVMFLTGRIWVRALVNGTPVSFLRILAMRLRGSPPGLLVDAYVALSRDGSPATLDDVEKAFLDSGNRMLSSGELADVVKGRGGKR